MKETGSLAMDLCDGHGWEEDLNRREQRKWSQAKLGTNMKTTEIRRHGGHKTGQS